MIVQVGLEEARWVAVVAVEEEGVEVLRVWGRKVRPWVLLGVGRVQDGFLCGFSERTMRVAR